MQDIVLCKIYRKATSLKVLEQRAAMEDEMKLIYASSPLSTLDDMSFCSQQEDPMTQIYLPHVFLKQEVEDLVKVKDSNSDDDENCNNKVYARDEKSKENKGSSLQLPFGNEKLPELELPKFSMDWNQDTNFLFNSPWLQSLTQNLTPSANILNF